MSVFATIDPKFAHQGICAFVVDMDWDGVSSRETHPKAGPEVFEHCWRAILQT